MLYSNQNSEGWDAREGEICVSQSKYKLVQILGITFRAAEVSSVLLSMSFVARQNFARSAKKEMGSK